jgi:hypothetical protein
MRLPIFVSSFVALSACAPDPMLGSFNFTLNGTETETAPRSQTTTSTGAGTLAVTTGKTVDYVLTVAQTDASPCVLEADRNDKGDVVSITPAQKCTFVFPAGQVTATMTTGTVTVSEKGESLTVNVTYTYAGTTLGINFAGTGSRTYTGPRR